jgi:hypothetical protein
MRTYKVIFEDGFVANTIANSVQEAVDSVTGRFDEPAIHGKVVAVE